MTSIQLYNTRTRKKEPFEPIDPANVRMYVCGPTVYDRAHIGNARPVVVFDVLFRLLRHVYGDKAVTYARNFTDVDDKINARAAESGRSIREITDETIGWYHEDMDKLGALRPTLEPRCTDFVPQMVAMTERLIVEGHAYEAEGHVLFDVGTYKDYGKLSRRSLDDMVAGARVEVAPYKKNPMDFVIWKPSTPDQPGWDSPWGRGRPGWHIECSAMAQALLGDVFDIHGGGIDLAFPHHENEVAQSCCANHTDVMANVWMHNDFLQVAGEKMAKSSGNFITVKELRDLNIPGSVIRYVLLSSYYRDPLDWTTLGMDEAQRTLARWGEVVGNTQPGEVPTEFMVALADDLNTPKCMEVLHALAKEERAAELRAATQFLGLGLIFEVRSQLSASAKATASLTVVKNVSALVATQVTATVDEKEIDVSYELQQLVKQLIEDRKVARNNREYAKADLIRDSMRSAGVELMDSKDGTDWRLARALVDSASYFEAFKAALNTNDVGDIVAARARAKDAGIHFRQNDPKIVLAWRTIPSEGFVLTKLQELQTVEVNK
jgi:cysteinyl-tRNA synthetase